MFINYANSKADSTEQQQDAFLKMFEVIANAQNYLHATNEHLNTRPLKLLLREWADINEGAKPKFTNIKSKKAKQGGRPKLVEVNHVRALLVAAVKIKINQGLKVGEAEKQVSNDTGIKPNKLRAWRSDFGRKDGPPKDITELANRLEKYGNPTQQYENLINQFNSSKNSVKPPMFHTDLSIDTPCISLTHGGNYAYLKGKRSR